MKRTLFSILFCALCICIIKAQDITPYDSITQRIKIKDYEGPKIYVDLLNELAWILRYDSTDIAFNHALVAHNMADSIDYKEGLGDASMRVAVIERVRGNLANAEKYNAQAIRIREKLPRQKGLAGAYNSLGSILTDRGYYESAKQAFSDALISYKSNGNLNGQARVLNNSSLNEQAIGNYESAIAYLDSAQVIYEEANNPILLGDVFINKANIFTEFLSQSKAEDYFGRALQIFNNEKFKNQRFKCFLGLGTANLYSKKYEKAAEFYDNAFHYLDNVSKPEKYKLYVNKGVLSMERKEYNQAIDFYNKALEQINPKEQHKEFANITYNKGMTYLLKEDYNKAREYFNQTEQIVTNFYDPLLQSKLNNQLSQIEEAQGNYKVALKYEAQSNQLFQKIKNQYIKAINLQSDLDASKAEKESLSQQTENQALRIQQQQYQVWGGFLVSGFLALGLFNLIRERRMRRREREINDLLREQELKLAYSRLEGEEKARTQIAQELHDGIGGLLSTIKLNFKAMENRITALEDDTTKKYQQAALILDKAVDEVRRISHELKSGMLNHFGLKAELEELAEAINTSKKLKVNLLTHNWGKQSNNKIDLELYRIIQEIISNVLKHAEAEKLSIQLNKFDDLINLNVEDNGKGFDLKKVKGKDGIGLKGIEARVQNLNGELNIDTSPGHGTRFNIDIPLI